MMGGLFGWLGEFHNHTVESQCGSGYTRYIQYTHHRVKWTIRPNFGDSDWTLKFFFSNLVFSRGKG